MITHVNPVIHGQAMMASQLLECSSEWAGIELSSLNTVYSEERGKLSGFSFKKFKLLCSYMRKARKIIKKEGIDTVIMTPAFFLTPFIKDGLFALFLRWTTEVKLMAWVHMDPNRLAYEEQNYLIKKFIRTVTNSYEAWLACAPSLINLWPKWLTDNHRCAYVCNGIPELPGSRSEASSQGDNTINVLYLSAMDTEKGWIEMLEIAQDLRHEYPNVKFDFYGGIGKQHKDKEIKAIFDAQNDPNIMWFGEVQGKEKSQVLLDADVFVFPSHTEQFPISILEAMSAGLSIVATDVGAIKDALPETELVKSQDKVQFKKMLSERISDESLRKKEGGRNRKKFVEQFSDLRFGESWREYLINN